MGRAKQFRWILPVAQTILAALFGGWGLWERNQILSHSFLGWNSTARFHVWPWQFKFAAVLNMPAFLCGMLLSWPIGNLWPKLSESVQAAPTLVFVALLWYWIGCWLDRRWRTSTKMPWILLFSLSLVSAGVAWIPVSSFASYTSYLEYGILVWMILGLGFRGSAIYRKRSPRAG